MFGNLHETSLNASLESISIMLQHLSMLYSLLMRYNVFFIILVTSIELTGAEPFCSSTDATNFEKMTSAEMKDLNTCMKTSQQTYQVTDSKMKFCAQLNSPTSLPLSDSCVSCLGATYVWMNNCDTVVCTASDAAECWKCKRNPKYNLQFNYCWTETATDSSCSAVDELAVNMKDDREPGKVALANTCIGQLDPATATVSLVQDCYSNNAISNITTGCATCQLDLRKSITRCGTSCGTSATSSACTTCTAGLATNNTLGDCFKHTVSYGSLEISGSATKTSLFALAFIFLSLYN